MGEGRKEGREKVERKAVKNRYLLSLVPPCVCVYFLMFFNLLGQGSTQPWHLFTSLKSPLSI